MWHATIGQENKLPETERKDKTKKQKQIRIALLLNKTYDKNTTMLNIICWNNTVIYKTVYKRI